MPGSSPQISPKAQAARVHQASEGRHDQQATVPTITHDEILSNLQGSDGRRWRRESGPQDSIFYSGNKPVKDGSTI